MSGLRADKGIANARNAQVKRALKAMSLGVLDRVFPPVCLACDAPISDHQHLCAPCWAQIVPITAPICPVLGLPFAMDLGRDAKSAEAWRNPRLSIGRGMRCGSMTRLASSCTI